MKALLLKDMYVLYKQLKILLFALVIFCVMPGFSASIFAMIYVIMLPITTLSYDERSKWTQLAAMMPYTARQLVLSKYLLGYFGAVIVMVLTAVSRLITGGEAGSSLLALLLTPCVGAFILAVLLPVMIRLGTEKGRLAYILTVGVLAGVSAGLDPGTLPSFNVSPAMVLIVAYGAVIILSLLSVRLSVRFYEKQKV